MKRRVRRRGNNGKEVLPSYPENDDELTGSSDHRKKNELVDWTRLADDTVIQLFTRLNNRDRASLSSTCRAWKILGSSPCLWRSLDLRGHKCDANMAESLSSRCSSLQKLRFRGEESADVIIDLRAKNLKEICGDGCGRIVDATLSVIAARHEALESLQIGPDFCEKISSDTVKLIAKCCPKLRKLRLSGLRDVDANAMNALAKHCLKLVDLGFIDGMTLNEVGLGRIESLRFLSVAGTTDLDWTAVSQHWVKLPNLIGLDVSRTTLTPVVASRLLSHSKSLKVLCALNCTVLEEDTAFTYNTSKGTLLLSIFSDVFKALASLFGDVVKRETEVFSYWRTSIHKDKKVDDIMTWVEWILSHTLLILSESNSHDMDSFWISQGASLLLNLLTSSQEDVQERAATGLASFVIIEDEIANNVDVKRAEAVMHGGGVRILLNLATSWRNGFQAEVAKAIANLSVPPSVAKAFAVEGGIGILANLARSMDRVVVEEAAGGLWNMSAGEHKSVIAEAGGIKALVDLIFKWSPGNDCVLERAAGALANLAADDHCSLEFEVVGGVNSLVMLTRNCKSERVQEQAARGLANLAAHGDTNSSAVAVGQEAGAVESLLQLTHSAHEGVRQEAAGALWNLSFNDRNREAIATAGGIEVLVALANSSLNASASLQERAAGALWGMSVSEANSLAIGEGGGVTPLLKLARSNIEDVHESAAGAIWNLAFNSGNALRIMEEGGAPTLVYLCSSSGSKMARFMAALALAYMFDRRMDRDSVEALCAKTSKSMVLFSFSKSAFKAIEAFVHSFTDFSTFSATSSPAALTKIIDATRIREAGHLRCSMPEIGRFVAMLRSPSSALKACGAFALVQFTNSGGRHAMHHIKLLQDSGASRVLRAAAACANAPIAAKILAKIVLRNIENHCTM
ncbi:protein ARABIDILLO 1-like [Impatiens glandulifera]|uniref:protein ARABIDILLO 1-like n=1 Tax=Impatiens glandulifera TaxID=253017 RepID=UPI001FB0EF87|nr:protein ARABIDILLO 1-like [Impatiens glandulifera]